VEKISTATARRMMLAAQGLEPPPAGQPTRDYILHTIRRMGVLQIDTINVVARSPYLVLWSRLAAYNCAWLDELLADGKLFEYWSHAMCLLPIEDYPLYRRDMLEFPHNRSGWLKWIDAHPEAIERVRARLNQNGEVRSVEFENKQHVSGGWWNWKDEKTALEYLLSSGEIMVARRQNFQRVYTLRERILPHWDDAALPALEDVRRELTLRTVAALGVAAAHWVADYYRLPKKEMSARLERLADEGLLLRVTIEGIDAPAYVHPDHLTLLEGAAQASVETVHTTLLSPFDPLVWDRQRARQLFNFDYTIECYTPAPKRLYGYFSLPILRRGRLIGRLDPKAHRAKGFLEIKSLHLEPDVQVDDLLISDLAGALHRFADWHDTPSIAIGQTNPSELAEPLSAALAQIT